MPLPGTGPHLAAVELRDCSVRLGGHVAERVGVLRVPLEEDALQKNRSTGTSWSVSP